MQRFALEISHALARVTRARGEPPPVMLTPAATIAGSATPDLPRRMVGRWHGQVWEQLELPRAARDGVLLNLGNTAPLWGGKRIVIIHDAGIFSQPGSYSWKFRLWYRLLHTLLRHTRAQLVTVSEFSRTELSRYLRIPPGRIAVMSEGAEHITRVPPDTTILTRHGLAPRQFVLVVGNLAPHKNLARLDALARVLAMRGIPLVISGRVNTTIFNASGMQSLPRPATYIGVSAIRNCARCTGRRPASCFHPCMKDLACRRWRPWPAAARLSRPTFPSCTKYAARRRCMPIPLTPKPSHAA